MRTTALLFYMRSAGPHINSQLEVLPGDTGLEGHGDLLFLSVAAAPPGRATVNPASRIHFFSLVIECFCVHSNLLISRISTQFMMGNSEPMVTV